MRRKKPFRILKLILRTIVITAAAAIAVSYLSIFINPQITAIPLFFGLYFIPLLSLNIVLLIIGFIRKSKILWITFAALLPALLFTDLFVRWGEKATGEDGLTLKICTYNVGAFSHAKEGRSRDATSSDIRKFIIGQSPDIICFQEYYATDTISFPELFPGYRYLYHHLFRARNGAFVGNVILSRYPIRDGGKILFEKSTNLCIYADIDLPDKTIRIYNAHLESHGISFTTLIKKLRESRNMTVDIYEVHDKMAGTFRKRATQVDIITEHSKNAPCPSIICGDFNDTPISYTYHRLTNGKRDSFKQAGKGFSATYSVFWPLLRIDYILYPEPFWSSLHTTPQIAHSDHYPVIVEVVVL